MAVKVWLGAVDGNPTVGGNWSDGTGWANGDQVIFTGGYTNPLTANNYTGVALASVEKTALYLADFGSSSTWMEFDTDRFTVDNASANCYVALQNGNANADIEVYIIGATAPSDLALNGLHIKVRAAANDNLVGKMTAGYASIDGGDMVSFTAINPNDLRIEAATGSPDLVLMGGVASSKATLDEFTNNGGVLTTQSSMAIATIYSFNGTIDWQSTGGVTTKIFGYAGQMTTASAPRRFTIAALDQYEMNIIANNALGAPTITTHKQYGTGSVYSKAPASMAATPLTHP